MAKLDKIQMQKLAAKASADGMKQHEIFADKEKEVLNQEQLSIMNWLQSVKFRKQIFGGLNQEDVWKKIHELDEMYEAALRAERIRYDVLLERQRSSIQEEKYVNDGFANE